jgi:5'-deoxynucleotidase YfbR-like HD superfamily hydrolase
MRTMRGEHPEAPAIHDRLAGPPTSPAILNRLTVPPTWTGEDWIHFQGLVGGKHPHGALYMSGLVPASYTVRDAVAYHEEGPHNLLGPFLLAFGNVMRATEDEQGRPESDSTHTVILALAALDLARQVVAHDASAAAEFDPQRVFALALVHDLVETYAGDVSTLRALSAEAKKAKEEREYAALGRIIREMGDCSWLIGAITEYEAQTSVEAIFVRLLDKATPKWTHEINGCAVPRKRGMTPEELHYEHRRQFDLLRWDLSSHPALRVAGMVLQASGQRAVESYGFRYPVPAYRRDVDLDGD